MGSDWDPSPPHWARESLPSLLAGPRQEGSKARQSVFCVKTHLFEAKGSCCYFQLGTSHLGYNQLMLPAPVFLALPRRCSPSLSKNLIRFSHLSRSLFHVADSFLRPWEQRESGIALNSNSQASGRAKHMHPVPRSSWTVVNI